METQPQQHPQQERRRKELKVVVMSDTHNRPPRASIVPSGDILIHCGDFSNLGSEEEIRQFNDYLKELPHRHKIVIAGNMDMGLSSRRQNKTLLTDCIYLEDSGVVIEGYTFYGSPYTPKFVGVFQLLNAKESKEKWAMIPRHNLDVLITHGPPLGHLDSSSIKSGLGCPFLKEVVDQIRPRFHVFGHIHNSYGREDTDHVTYINAAIYNGQPPLQFTLTSKE